MTKIFIFEVYEREYINILESCLTEDTCHFLVCVMKDTSAYFLVGSAHLYFLRIRVSVSDATSIAGM